MEYAPIDYIDSFPLVFHVILSSRPLLLKWPHSRIPCAHHTCQTAGFRYERRDLCLNRGIAMTLTLAVDVLSSFKYHITHQGYSLYR